MSDSTAWVDDGNVALFTDLYELTMLQAYFEQQMFDVAEFSLFIRRLPDTRNYFLACGLEDVLDYLERLHFTTDSIDYLASLGTFSDRFLNWLADFRFTGDVFAVREGTPVFADEPILELVAPLPEAQLIETYVMNQVHLQTMLASKAARVVAAAAGRSVVDFGARRIHGTDAAVKGARAFTIAGVAGTSNVLAGSIHGIPVMGTMAHSFIQAWGHEADAFRAFAAVYPETVLLIDTYDTVEGARKVVALARELGADFRIKAVRLDSGDLAALAGQCRAIFDAAGLTGLEIIASGGLDEYKVAGLVAAGAPIDGFGVGTAMGVSDDTPSLDIAYKLVSYAGHGRLKLAPGKVNLPGRKQVFRGGFDVIARHGETLPGRPLLEPVMKSGRRLAAPRPLSEMAEYAAAQIAALPEHVRALTPAEPPYKVEVSEALTQYQAEVTREFAG
jgi:nicotinate phosphoribosyltransferase